jgi:hypothetical protein
MSGEDLSDIVGSGEHEARQNAVGRKVVNVVQRIEPVGGDTLLLEFDNGTLEIRAGRLYLRWLAPGAECVSEDMMRRYRDRYREGT